MPVGAFGGKKEIMDMVAPVGPVYLAGTLSGNPIAMGCGYTLLKELNEIQEFISTEETQPILKKNLDACLIIKTSDTQLIELSDIKFSFDVDEVNNFDDAFNVNADLFKTLFHWY